MTDKQQIRAGIDWLQRVQTWKLVLILIVLLLLTATFLRLNNIGMIERRNAVIAADEAGDDEVTRSRLYQLQRYAAAHMNADTGVVYLAEQYRRDTERAIAAASMNNGGDNINARADATCKARHAGYSQAYVQCFAAELAKYPSGSNAPDKANLPNPSLYRHTFFSPDWSPDFAGFSVLASALLTVVILLRFLAAALLRVLLRRHYSSI